jgi:O-succinylbenzoic acid--CoA ligase
VRRVIQGGRSNGNDGRQGIAGAGVHAGNGIATTLKAMRQLLRTPVPPGPAGVLALADVLTDALAGTGPALAPVPTTSVTISDEYVARLMRALRPDDPTAPLEDDSVAVVMATSGSTGTPRGVLLTASALTAMSEQVNGPGGSTRWIAALPLTSMGGFNVLVRALTAGHPPIALASIGGAVPFTPADFSRAVASAASDDIRVSLVSAQLRRLLTDDAGLEALRACSQILIGAGPLPAAIRAAAEDLGIQLTTTYGSTETSGGCVYNGIPLRGVSITTPAGSPGEVLVNGPMLALGYRCEPALTAARFTPAGYRTTDLGQIDDAGHLTLLGRMDDVVTINGVNVSIGAVEQAIEDSPNVVAAIALDLPASDGEAELIAIVIQREHGGDLRAEITAQVLRSLGRAAVPRRVALVPEFPPLPNGKVDRAALRTAAMTGELTWLQ